MCAAVKAASMLMLSSPEQRMVILQDQILTCMQNIQLAQMQERANNLQLGSV
jgi:hypothetical protein